MARSREDNLAKYNRKTDKTGRAAAFTLANHSNPISMGNPLEATEKAMALAEWIGDDPEKVEAVELVLLVTRKSANYKYLVNHVKQLYGQITGLVEAKVAEPPEKEPVEPAKADNSTPTPGTTRRPSKRPRKTES